MHELVAISDGIVVDLSVERSVDRERYLDAELEALRSAGSPPAAQAVPNEAGADVLTIDLSQVNAGSNGLPPELAWQERALCAQTDPEAFFPEKGGSTREAKRVCMACDVRADCLEYALAKDERFGIWGGLSERERRRVKKRAV